MRSLWREWFSRGRSLSDYREMRLFGPENRRERNCAVEGDESPGVLYCQGEQVNVGYLFGAVNAHVVDDCLVQNA